MSSRFQICKQIKRVFFNNKIVIYFKETFEYAIVSCGSGNCHLKGGISTGNPTLIKNLAKDCDKCSLYGGNKRNLLPLFLDISTMKLKGTLKTLRKSTTKYSVSYPSISHLFNK